MEKVKRPATGYLLSCAYSCLDAESEALLNAKKSIDESLIDALKVLSGCKGKRLFTGVGKSFIVAEKIASSFCSMGYASFAIDPLRLMHGDLGALSKDDIVVAVSNSGETEILLQLIKHMKDNGLPIISIVGNKKSTLTKLSDHSIVVETKEAGPFGLIPSTSTTVMMAIGDAMLCGLVEMDNRTIDVFINNHPAGSILKMRH